MKYQVELKYFEDDQTGIWGFAHRNTYNHATPFNAFYETSGIFHDVFEHYFEGSKYFPDISVYGELCATAHKYFITESLGLNPFQFSPGSPYPDYYVDTMDEFRPQENYFAVDPRYCRVPDQKPCVGIEDFVTSYLCKVDDEGYPVTPQQRRAIRNSLRLGYRMAEKKWDHDHYNSIRVLYNFLYEWDQFTKTKNAEGLFIEDDEAYGLSYLRFAVDTRQGTVKCTAVDEIHREWPLELLQSY